MRNFLIIPIAWFMTILPTAKTVGQDFVIDPTMINIGTRYMNFIFRLYHETADNTVLVVGDFSGGFPQIPYIHKVNWNIQPVTSWAQGTWGLQVGTSSGPDFYRASDGYWLGGGYTLRKISLNGVWNFIETNNGPFESFQSTCGWADEQDMVYAGGLFLHWDGISLRRSGILRHHPDGSLDEGFPLVPVSRTVSQTADVRRITEYNQDRLIISGLFDTIQGHYCPRIAMMFKSGIIDTSFTSPFGHYGEVYPVHIDSQGRMLVSYPYSTRANPLDTAAAWRLMPDGSLDPNFTPLRLNRDPTPELGLPGNLGAMLVQKALQTSSGGYIIGGNFDYATGIPRTYLAEIDSTGEVLPVSFETNLLFMDTILHPWFNYFGPPLIYVSDMLETPDGSILIGGRFSGFNGQVSLNLVKIKRDTETGTWQVDVPKGASVYPNPAWSEVQVSVQGGRQLKSIAVHDLTGRLIYTQAATGTQASMNTNAWGAGTYVLRITYQNGDAESKRVVVVE